MVFKNPNVFFYTRFYKDIFPNFMQRVQGTWNKKNRANNYDSLLKEISKQFKNEKHPFRIIQEYFEKYILEIYEINENLSDENLILLKARLLKDATDIIKVLSFVIIKFYHMKLPLTERNSDLFLIPITDLIIRSKTHDLIVKILLHESQAELAKFRLKLASFRHLKLEKLKINKYFRFDNDFRSTFNKLRVSVDSSKMPTFQEEELILQESITTFNKIKEIYAPMEKCKQLLKVTKTLIKEIDEFWENCDINHEKLIMDPDSLLSLLIYVVSKSQYSEIIIDHKLMEIFITEADKTSIKGYYLVTLGIAIDWILQQNPDSFTTVIL